MLNPLQIRQAPHDDETETERLYVDEGNGISDMALHIKTLEVFLIIICRLLPICRKQF